MSALTTLETDLDCVGDVCVKDDDLFWSVSFFLKKCEIIRPENRIFLFVSNRFFLRIFPSRFRSMISTAPLLMDGTSRRTRARVAFLLVLLPSIRLSAIAFPRRARNHSDPFWNSIGLEIRIHHIARENRSVDRGRSAEKRNERTERRRRRRQKSARYVAPEPWWP